MNLAVSCGWASSCASGAELCCRRRSGPGCPSPCGRTHAVRSARLAKSVRSALAWVLTSSPGVVLPAVRRLGLAGAFVSGGGRARRRAAAAPRAAALPDAVFAAGLVLLPARRVRVVPRGCRRAPVVLLSPTGAAVPLGGVAALCPGRPKRKRKSF